MLLNSSASPLAAKGKVKGALNSNLNNGIIQQPILHFFDSIIIVERCEILVNLVKIPLSMISPTAASKKLCTHLT